MRTAAFTRVYDDTQTKLRIWLSYYSKYFDDIYVVGCQSSEVDIEKIRGVYDFTYIPTQDQIHSIESLGTISATQVKLLEDHRWVFYSDMDEIVVPKWGDLRGFMKRCKVKQTFCEGYDVYKTQDEAPIDWWQPVLKQRKYWWKDVNASYNKPLLSQIPTKWVHGFHRIDGMSDSDIREVKGDGLWLAHLRHINDTETTDPTHVAINGGPASEIPEKVREAI